MNLLITRGSEGQLAQIVEFSTSKSSVGIAFKVDARSITKRASLALQMNSIRGTGILLVENGPNHQKRHIHDCFNGVEAPKMSLPCGTAKVGVSLVGKELDFSEKKKIFCLF